MYIVYTVHTIYTNWNGGDIDVFFFSREIVGRSSAPHRDLYASIQE